jgi:hypothetical protein
MTSGTEPLRSHPTVAGHPGISWSIVLRAVPAAPVDPEAAAARLAVGWPADGSAGPPPAVGPDSDEPDLLAAANEPYAEGGPFVRVLVGPGTVLVAGHHAVLDGLGLVAVLGLVVGADLGTTSRGVRGATEGGAVRRLAYPVARMGEALVRPPDAIAHGEGLRRPGDRLAATTIGESVGTAQLVAAAAHAVRRWNAGRGARAARVVVAIGASARSGRRPTVGRAAAWFRVEVPKGTTAAGVRRLLQERGSEPAAGTTVLRAARASGLAAKLERRTGSTMLVSNLGELMPRDAVTAAEFYPSAHGRSGVAIGAIRAGGRTTLTVRARASDFTDEEASRFLELVADRVTASPTDPAR